MNCKTCKWYRRTHYKGTPTSEEYDECECHWGVLHDLNGCQDYEPKK